MKSVTYTKNEVQEVIDRLIMTVPDIARSDQDVLPILDALKVLVELKNA